MRVRFFVHGTGLRAMPWLGHLPGLAITAECVCTEIMLNQRTRAG
jgi:hypothetical protein